MRSFGPVFIVGLLILGLLSHGIVLVQLSYHPERGHRAPPEAFRADQVEIETDLLGLVAAGSELADPRAW
jgi:hypothetical protein